MTLPALDAVNELTASPWKLLHVQVANEAVAAIEKAIGQWSYKIGPRKIGPSFLKCLQLWNYEVTLSLNETQVGTSLAAPPGYEALSESGFRVAVPLRETWGVSVDTVMRGNVRVWFRLCTPGPGVDVQAKLKLALSGFRMVGDAGLEAAPDVAWPLLRRMSLKPAGQIQLSTPLAHLTLELEKFRVVAEPEGTVRFEYEIRDLRLFALSPSAEAVFSGVIILRPQPTLTFQLKGELLIHLPWVGQEKIPFSWELATGITLPLSLLNTLHSALDGPIPRNWGETPPPDLTQPPPTVDFLARAFELEQGISDHIPYGGVFEIVDSEPKAYGDAADSAIWTGHYLAAEAFRYAVTIPPEARAQALERVWFVFRGIQKMYGVTQVPGLPARAALPKDSPIQANSPDFLTAPADQVYGPVTLDGADWYGLGRGSKSPSRDSYIGLMLGLAHAFHFVQEAQLREEVAALVTATLRNLLTHHWCVVTPAPPSSDGTAPSTLPIVTTFLGQYGHQLALLRVGKLVNPAEFGALYDRLASAAPLTWLTVWGSMIDPLSDPYKYNLAHASALLLLFFEEDPRARAGYARMFSMLRARTARFRNAYYDLLSVLVAPPPERQALLEGPGGYDPRVTLAEEIRAILYEWLLRLESVASPNGMPLLNTPDPEYLQKLYPSSVAPYTPVGAAQVKSWESVFALPVQKRPGSNMEFLWQNDPFATGYQQPFPPWPPSGPFDPSQISINPGASPPTEGPAVDYLLPVWIASYLGVIPKP